MINRKLTPFTCQYLQILTMRAPSNPTPPHTDFGCRRNKRILTTFYKTSLTRSYIPLLFNRSVLQCLSATLPVCFSTCLFFCLSALLPVCPIARLPDSFTFHTRPLSTTLTHILSLGTDYNYPIISLTTRTQTPTHTITHPHNHPPTHSPTHTLDDFVILGATKHLYNWLCPSVGR